MNAKNNDDAASLKKCADTGGVSAPEGEPLENCAKPYHHGDLRNALITAAAELIEQNGSLEFSITDAARCAGVSSAAPYRHFKAKEDLLRAVRELAFLGLHRAMSEGAQRAAPGSSAQIIALGESYLAFAQEKQAFFGLMWEDRADIAYRRQEAKMKMSGFRVVLAACETYCAQHSVTVDTNPMQLATQLWALAHGIATLKVNQMLDLFDANIDARAILRQTTIALLEGLHTKPL